MAASWLHLLRVSPALHPPEKPSHTHTPKPVFGGRGLRYLFQYKTTASTHSLYRYKALFTSKSCSGYYLTTTESNSIIQTVFFVSHLCPIGSQRTRLPIPRNTAKLSSYLWSLRMFPSLPDAHLTIFYRDVSSALLQLVNQWLKSCLTRIELSSSALNTTILSIDHLEVQNTRE